MAIRELTAVELREINRFAKSMCANYDDHYNDCVLLSDSCYMTYGFGYTNTAMCKWFKKAVLPIEPGLERLLTDGGLLETKPCGICGKEFPLNRRQTYCSEKCAKVARLKSVAKNVRAHRKRKRGEV